MEDRERHGPHEPHSSLAITTTFLFFLARHDVIFTAILVHLEQFRYAPLGSPADYFARGFILALAAVTIHSCCGVADVHGDGHGGLGAAIRSMRDEGAFSHLNGFVVHH